MITLKNYFFFLLFLTYLPLFSLPTCYLSLEQSEAQHLYNKDLWPTEQYKHQNHYAHLQSTKNVLLNYSTADLQHYFGANGYSEKDILSYDVMYMSNEFVQLAKTYSGYEKAIIKLYKKLTQMWFFQRAVNYLFSNTYYPKLLKRVNRLYKELRAYQQVTTQNATSFAQLYDINLLMLYSHNSSLVTHNIYKTYIDILHQASTIPLHNSIMRDCIGQASKIGLEANKHGYTQQASQIAGFCWAVIDCAQAFGEGIFLGTVQTVDAITHPVQTIKNSLIGIGIIVHALGQVTATTGECLFLYATDTNRYYIRQDAIICQLKKISEQATNYMQKTPTREIIKQGSAFITEGVLLARIGTFAYNLSKRLAPLTKNYFEYIAKKDPTICPVSGAVYVDNIIESLLPKNVLNKIKTAIQQKLKPLGRGNTGRSTARNLHEQLALEEIMSDPTKGFEIRIGKGMTDSRWHKEDGWIKNGWIKKGLHHDDDIEIHYVAQKIDGIIVAIDDFKFK